MALCVTCGQDTELGVAAPSDTVWRPISAQLAESSHQTVAAGESVVRSAECPCSKDDSTLWCNESAACSDVHPYGRGGTTKTNTEIWMLQGAAVCVNTDM